MSNIIKSREAANQMLIIDKALGDIITRLQDIDDEMKELRMKLRQTPEAKRLRELVQQKKSLTVERIEAIGQRKLVIRLLRKLGIEIPETKLTKMIHQDESLKSYIAQ